MSRDAIENIMLAMEAEINKLRSELSALKKWVKADAPRIAAEVIMENYRGGHQIVENLTDAIRSALSAPEKCHTFGGNCSFDDTDEPCSICEKKSALEAGKEGK